MEPEAHRLDREAIRSEHLAIAERVHHDVDDAVAAAAEKRRAYLDWFVTHMRIEANGELERERRWADLRLSSRTGAATARKPAAPTPHRAGDDAEVEDAALAWAATG